MQPVLCKHCGRELRKAKYQKFTHLVFWIHQTAEEHLYRYNNPLTDQEKDYLRYCRITRAEPVEKPTEDTK